MGSNPVPLAIFGMRKIPVFILVASFFFCLETYADVFLSTYAEVKSAYDLVGYTWKSEKVPRIFAKSIPEEIKKLEGAERRQFFIKLILPLVLLENEKIAAEHDMIVPIAAKKEWKGDDLKIISEIAQKYNIIEEDQDSSGTTEEEKEEIRYFLDHKIRPIPPAIAVGQAALESGWGTSRFVFEGNNLFGHVSPDPAKGLKPKNWSGNQRHIRIFDSIQESISAYMLNLNRNRAYNKFRWYRRTHPNNLSKMAEGFDRYAIIKEAYVGRLQSVMFKFGVYKINNAKLDSGESADVIEKVSQPYIVYKLDRFARNRYDSAIYKAKLKQRGIKLLSAMEKITDSPEGIIMEGLLEAMSEYYSAELSQKIRRGIRENVIKGKHIGGVVCLGYKLGPDHVFEIDESEAKIVRLIFSLYQNGKTLAEITNEVNEVGYRTAKGNLFGKNSIGKILHNERYTGHFKVKGMPEEGVCPAIIEQSVFDEVNAKLEKGRQKHRHSKGHEYILSGLLFCGDCGERMTGASGTGKLGKTYNYYKCKCQRVKAESIEIATIEAIDEYLHSDCMKAIAKIAYKEYRNQIADTSELDCVKKRNC